MSEKRVIAQMTYKRLPPDPVRICTHCKTKIRHQGQWWTCACPDQRIRYDPRDDNLLVKTGRTVEKMPRFWMTERGYNSIHNLELGRTILNPNHRPAHIYMDMDTGAKFAKLGEGDVISIEYGPPDHGKWIIIVDKMTEDEIEERKTALGFYD